MTQPPEIFARIFGMLDRDRAVIGVTLGEPSTRGLRIEEVAEDSPAARAGLEAGDYITAIGDVSLRLDQSDLDDPVLRTAAERRLRRALERVEAGDAVTLRVAGDGGERTVRVATVRADSLESRTGSTPARTALWGADDDRAVLGVSVASTGTVRDTLGAFVASVVPGGPAERAGIYEGARIAAVNGMDLRLAPADTGDRVIASATAARLQDILADLDAGDEVTLRVYDGGRYRDVRVRTAKASEVYDDATGLLRLTPGTGFLLPEAGARGLLRVAPGARGERLRVERLPRGRIHLRSAPDVDVELRRFDALEPTTQERVRERLDEARRRVDEARPHVRLLRPGSRWYELE
ncbi:MAG TPA: PDZ domain-containing protein [Gemmatimonadaceae bacterium]|nr:PDZ domain-containing protein [Gemmatimonadaceae bacterium]